MERLFSRWVFVELQSGKVLHQCPMGEEITPTDRIEEDSVGAVVEEMHIPPGRVPGPPQKEAEQIVLQNWMSTEIKPHDQAQQQPDENAG